MPNPSLSHSEGFLISVAFQCRYTLTAGLTSLVPAKDLSSMKLMKESRVQRYVNSQGCMWEVNLPHSSHIGSAWECMIGVAS